MSGIVEDLNSIACGRDAIGAISSLGEVLCATNAFPE